MLSLVIPAFNEVLRLPGTLVRARAHLDAAGEEYEVIVVDDGSSDGTAAEAGRIAADWPQLSLIQLPVNSGKGAAVRAGMLRARGEQRAFSDADLSSPLEELARAARAPRGRLSRGDRISGAARVGHRGPPARPARVRRQDLQPALAPPGAPRHLRHPVRAQGLQRRGRGGLLHPASHHALRLRRRGAGPGPGGSAGRSPRCRCAGATSRPRGSAPAATRHACSSTSCGCASAGSTAPTPALPPRWRAPARPRSRSPSDAALAARAL